MKSQRQHWLFWVDPMVWVFLAAAAVLAAGYGYCLCKIAGHC